MGTRIAAATLTAAALLSLAACSSDSTSDSKPTSTPSTTASTTTDAPIPTLPPAPTGATRTAYLAAIAAIDPSLTADSDRIIDAGRDQCQALDDGAQNTDHLAAVRFGTDDHQLTDTQGTAINAALRATLCPKS